MHIQVDFDRSVGSIKPMHGVGQPPFLGTNFSMIDYLEDAGIPFSRLHDVGGAYGGYRWVDVPNIFRDFDKDPYDPLSYDFTFTDLLITALVTRGVEPFFRLGVTIENDAAIKSYRIDPPQDYHKWAVVCEHIVRHYTEGWADGFCYNIRYWEIWNEPDNYEQIEENQMWRGTKEQYYALYEVASKHLKQCFPHLRIGGYASCGFYAISQSQGVAEAKVSPRLDYFVTFFEGFLAYISEKQCPLDFFSWHSYGSIGDNKIFASYARRLLDEYGFAETETTCNEWNCNVPARGTYHHAALSCAMMLSFQHMPLDSAMFYDARFGVSVYGALFHPLTAKPFPAYYAFKAYDQLYKRGEEVALSCDREDAYAVAARDEDGVIVIANPTEEDIPLTLTHSGVVGECYMTSEGGCEMPIELPKALPKNSILVVGVLL